MCKIGDIIGVDKYIGQDGTKIGYHYFIVVSNENGKIYGYDFNLVGTVMSSYKNEYQKKRKSHLEENLDISESEFDLGFRQKRKGFIKANQLFYFDKNNLSYSVVGQVDGDVLLKLLDKIGYLDSKHKLFSNISNLYKIQV